MVIHRRTGCTARNALRPFVAVLGCLALLAAGCSSSGGLKAGDAATFVAGYAGEVSVDGEVWEAPGDGAAIPDGARVRAPEGEVRLALRDGTARLAPGAAATVTAESLELERGELLLDSDGGLEATLGDTQIVAGGTVRVSSGLAANVAVYEGKASVLRPSQEREVATLRQLDLSAFRLAPTGQPLRYSARDAWDQELLAEAIGFDGEVARLARGMEIEFGRRPQPPTFYREFAGVRTVPVLSETAPLSRGRAFGPPADVLLTMFVAQTVAQGRLTDTIRQVAQLRAAGARWGLIAVEFDVASDALVAAVDGLDSERLALAERAPELALGAGGALAAAADDAGGGGGGGDAQTASASDTTTTTTSSGSGGSTSPDGSSGPSGGDGGGDEGDGDEDEETVEEVVSDVVTTVEDNLPDDDDPEGNAPLPKLPPLPEAKPAR